MEEFRKDNCEAFSTAALMGKPWPHIILPIFLIVVPQFFSSAYADWPVLLTKDSKTVLNLTKPENTIDLLECGMWIALDGRNYYLRNNSGKNIFIPRLAIKSIQDQSVADIALDAKLLGLQVRMMHVALRKQGEEGRWNAGTWSQEMRGKKRNPYYISQQISFLIEGSQQQLTDAINKAKATNAKLKDSTLIIYPPEESYQHLVMELVAVKELSENIGAPLLHWALLARGISNNVNSPFLEASLNGETGLIPADSIHRRPSPNVLNKIIATRPIRTQLIYTCLIEAVTSLSQ